MFRDCTVRKMGDWSARFVRFRSKNTCYEALSYSSYYGKL
jgi:hypothetical protein